MNANGSGAKNLTRDPGDDAVPRWSPDGRQVFFVSGREGDDQVFVMNSDGSGQTRLAETVAGYSDLAVAPR
jgi:TolB protein